MRTERNTFDPQDWPWWVWLLQGCIWIGGAIAVSYFEPLGWARSF